MKRLMVRQFRLSDLRNCLEARPALGNQDHGLNLRYTRVRDLEHGR